MIGRKLRSSRPPGGSIAVASGVPSMSRNVKNSGISRWTWAFSPISCSKETFEIGRKLCVALSCSLRKYFSTAWRIVSDSATASASVSMRNHVLLPGASQTYLMSPPNMASGANRHREGGHAMSREAKSGLRNESIATSAHLPLLGGFVDLPGYIRRIIGCFGPLTPQRDERCHQRRPQKQSQEAERLEPAENTEQHPQERQSRGTADQDGAHKMIGDEHNDAAADKNDDRADRVPDREQVEPGKGVDDGSRERDHRRY